MTGLEDPALARLGRVADLLEEAAKEIRNFVGSCRGDLDPLDGPEAECRSAAREPALREDPPMPTNAITTASVLLTQDQLADLLQVGARTLRRMRNDQAAKFPAPVRRARVLRWRRADVEAWVAERRP